MECNKFEDNRARKTMEEKKSELGVLGTLHRILRTCLYTWGSRLLLFKVLSGRGNRISGSAERYECVACIAEVMALRSCQGHNVFRSSADREFMRTHS